MVWIFLLDASRMKKKKKQKFQVDRTATNSEKFEPDTL